MGEGESAKSYVLHPTFPRSIATEDEQLLRPRRDDGSARRNLTGLRKVSQRSAWSIKIPFSRLIERFTNSLETIAVSFRELRPMIRRRGSRR